MTHHTHRYLGNVLFPVICEAWNVTLSRKRFISGSVKPDFSSLFIRHPHFWRLSRKFIFRKIRKLAKRPIRPGKKNGRFSEDLGIVHHYVADFFTSVHNVTPNPIGEHLRFEAKLHEDFVRMVSEGTLRTALCLIRGTARKPYVAEADGERSADDERDSINAVLKELHGRYIPEKNSPLADVREILVACLAVTARVMDAATANASAARIASERRARA